MVSDSILKNTNKDEIFNADESNDSVSPATKKLNESGSNTPTPES